MQKTGIEGIQEKEWLYDPLGNVQETEFWPCIDKNLSLKMRRKTSPA